MGNEIYYQDHNRSLGNVSKGRWVEMSKLIPLLLEFVNSNMEQNWGNHPPLDRRNFRMDELFRDESRTADEVFLLDADEMKRLFAWCRFLEEHSGAFSLYKPLVEELSSRVWEVAEYRPPNRT